jgi:hypothetical protein
MLRARGGQIEAVLCFLARFRARLRFARVVARTFRARLGVGRAAFGARAFAAASPAAATTTSTATPALAAVTTIAAITALRAPAALGSLWLLRSSLGFRRGLRRAWGALAMLLLATCTLSAIDASSVRVFARLALVTLSVTPVVAAAGRGLVLVVVTPTAITISIAMMTPVPVTIPVAAVAAFVPIASSFVR